MLSNLNRSFKEKEYFFLGRATASPFTVEEPSRIVPGAVTFNDQETMIKLTTASPVGTLAYLVEEEALLVRVNNGWQYIAVSIIISKVAAIFLYLKNLKFQA